MASSVLFTYLYCIICANQKIFYKSLLLHKLGIFYLTNEICLTDFVSYWHSVSKWPRYSMAIWHRILRALKKSRYYDTIKDGTGKTLWFFSLHHFTRWSFFWTAKSESSLRKKIILLFDLMMKIEFIFLLLKF